MITPVKHSQCTVVASEEVLHDTWNAYVVTRDVVILKRFFADVMLLGITSEPRNLCSIAHVGK
jgi:hypothetical protein